MEYTELLQILEDLHKELLSQSVNMTTIILVANHETGKAEYYTSGFVDVQASLIKLLLDKDKILATNLYFSVYEGKGS